MNLLQTLTHLLDGEARHIATITGVRGDGLWVATPIGGGVVLLTGAGSYSIGDKVYYDRVSGRLLAPAPDVVYGQWGV